MRDLIPSGRFAQLTRLSRKALRLYAEMGLLRAVHVNPGTGFKYYSLSQLEEAKRIGRLRDLGMPLEAIREALRTWNGPGLQAQLDAHRERLLEQATRVQQALAALEDLRRSPGQTYAVETKLVQAQAYLGVRAWCEPDESCPWIGAMQQRLLLALQDNLLQPAGSALARYHNERDDAWDIEVCLPFTGEAPHGLPEGTFVAQSPAGAVAYTVHAGECGGTYGLQEAYTAVWRWIQEHGHETLGGPYEVYLFDETNTVNPADYRTEIAWLLRP